MRRTGRNPAVQGLALQSAVPILALVPVGAFKLGAIWLLAIGLGFALGQPTAALILGAIPLPVCGVVAVTNFCVPSTLLGIWWRRRGTLGPATQLSQQPTSQPEEKDHDCHDQPEQGPVGEGRLHAHRGDDA